MTDLNSLINRITIGIREAGSVIIIKSHADMPYAFGPFTDEDSAFEFATKNNEIDQTLTVQPWKVNG